MLTLVVEFGSQRRKFNLTCPTNVNLLENEIKADFGIEPESRPEYFIQIYDERINDYVDLTSDLVNSTKEMILRGRIVSHHTNSFEPQQRLTEEQVVGLSTLESVKCSLEKWSQLLQNVQLEISKEIRIVEQTILAVQFHCKHNDEVRSEKNRPSHKPKSSFHAPSRVSPTSLSVKSIVRVREKDSLPASTRKDSTDERPQMNSVNQHGRTSSHKTLSTNRGHQIYYPPSHVVPKAVESHVPVTVMYQRFHSGVEFEAELSKYYNPTYFFVRITNQTNSYDEMNQQMNLYYNKIEVARSYSPQPGDFCVAKSPDDSTWYRARIVRLLGDDKVQLIFIDCGQINDVAINSTQPLRALFSERPAQALACSLSHVLPLTRGNQCGWSRRSLMSLENAMKAERLAQGKGTLHVTVAEHDQVKWPMMFVMVSTESISNLSDHLCDLYLSRRCSNEEISQFWSHKLRREQFVLFHISSLINQRQYFADTTVQSALTVDQALDLILHDLQFSRQ